MPRPLKTIIKQSVWILFGISLIALGACQTLDPQNHPQPGFAQHYGGSAQHYLKLAEEAATPEKQSLLLQAAGRFLQDHRYDDAEKVLSRVFDEDLLTDQLNEKYLLQANLALQQGRIHAATAELDDIADPNYLNQNQQIAYYHLQAKIQNRLGNALLSAEARMSLDPLLQNFSKRQANRQAIWNNLAKLSLRDLSSQIRSLPYGQLQGWLEISYAFKQYGDDTSLLDHEIKIWQQRYPQHPANTLLPNYHQPNYHPSNNPRQNTAKQNLTPARTYQNGLHVALLLPTKGKLSESAEAIRQGFMASYFQDQENQKAPKSINVYNTDKKNVLAVYKRAIADGSNFIIGPLTKKNVDYLQRQHNLPVQTLALNYGKSENNLPHNLFEFALSPNNEAQQVANRAFQQGYSKALIIAPSGSWGQGVITAFENVWRRNGGEVSDTLIYNKKTNMDQTIKQMLQIDKSNERNNELRRILGKKIYSTPGHRQDIDFIFLVANPAKARQIRPLLNFYYAGKLPVYSTSLVYSGKPAPLEDSDLEGIEFCDIPWLIAPGSREQSAREQMKELMPNASAKQIKLYAFGMDAYTVTQYLVTQPHELAGIDAMTGTLYLDNKHHIFRELPWAKFKKGQPENLPG